jgi:hypothetical protein
VLRNRKIDILQHLQRLSSVRETFANALKADRKRGAHPIGKSSLVHEGVHKWLDKFVFPATKGRVVESVATQT